jgi:hypothetical protein
MKHIILNSSTGLYLTETGFSGDITAAKEFDCDWPESANAVRIIYGTGVKAEAIPLCKKRAAQVRKILKIEKPNQSGIRITRNMEIEFAPKLDVSKMSADDTATLAWAMIKIANLYKYFDHSVFATHGKA